MSNSAVMCGRCYDIVDIVYPSNCQHRPETLVNASIGQHHCPDCGAMVMAGISHPDICKLCIDRKNPEFDIETG